MKKPQGGPHSHGVIGSSHPQLCQALRRDRRWRQLTAAMVGTNKAKSASSIAKAQAKQGKSAQGTGYGGHFRALRARPLELDRSPT